jgi:PAS domain S-box-containing protein
MDADGTPRMLEVSLADVTEMMLQLRHVTQTANGTSLLFSTLASSKAYIENILNSMVDALFVTSATGIMKTVNRAAAKMLGYSAQDLVDRPIQQFIQSDPSSGSFDDVHVKNHMAPAGNIQATCHARDGSEIPVLFSRSVIQLDTDPGVVYVGRDLREIKRVQATINRLQEENTYLTEELNAEHNFEEMIGSSPAMQEVFTKIQQVSGTDSTVLLLGETGTGKELIARALHNLSPRHEKVLVKVNCAALPSGLVESELFGHEKGAFTGATARRRGKFELAHEGTILLDEVSELPLETQSKLLRVLQEREFERVGGTGTLRVDVRIIAATNRNLLESVKMGAFREDLFYRLNVFPLQVPPLRMRGEDIPVLTLYFVDKFARKMHKHIDGVSQQCMERLRAYRWPGNVRELASVIERAVILCGGSTITDVDVATTGAVVEADRTKLDAVQRQHILDVLEQCAGVIEGPRGAASKLGIHPATLRSRLKKLGISRHSNKFTHRSKP